MQMKDYIIYVLFRIFYAIIGCFSFFSSSKALALIFSKLGKFTKADKTLKNNLKLCKFNQNLAPKIWGNLGKLIGEFPHIYEMPDKQVDELCEFTNLAIFENYRNKPVIIVSVHSGNWELAIRAVKQKNYNIAVIYRPLKNKLIDNFIVNLRNKFNIEQITKSLSGLRQIIKAVKASKVICFLADQKHDQGTKVTLFGNPVMATNAPAKISIEYGVDIVPVFFTEKNRKKHIIFFEALKPEKFKTPEELTQHINLIFENWISQHPEEWFWMHNRFNSKNKATT
jgi:KDO2-lipid IV(A) lauroyltransferase